VTGAAASSAEGAREVKYNGLRVRSVGVMRYGIWRG
jgi:hypothetical protein